MHTRNAPLMLGRYHFKVSFVVKLMTKRTTVKVHPPGSRLQFVSSQDILRSGDPGGCGLSGELCFFMTRPVHPSLNM